MRLIFTLESLLVQQVSFKREHGNAAGDEIHAPIDSGEKHRQAVALQESRITSRVCGNPGHLLLGCLAEINRKFIAEQIHRMLFTINQKFVRHFVRQTQNQ